MKHLRRLARLLFLFALVSASAAEASPRLVAPEAGYALTAGSLAAVEWEGSAPIEDAEEWEAFLSLDGGRTHPLRITPHLDISIRRFTFRVPAFPTHDARVLLRFGDERHEVEVETPQRFAILLGSGGFAPVARSLSRGERASPGEGGVVFWVEGARDGSGVREVVVEGAALAYRSVEPSRLPWLPLLPPGPQRTSFAAPSLSFERQESPPPVRTSTGSSPSAQDRPPVRLLISRFNE